MRPDRYSIKEVCVSAPESSSGVYDVSVITGISEDIEPGIIRRFEKNLKEMCREYSCLLIYVEDNDPESIYCRSAALNTGLRHAARKTALFAVCADIDVTADFDPVETTVDNAPDFGFFCIKCVNERGAHISKGRGGWLAASPETWYNLGGWDERLEGWGYEDNALYRRAAELGIPFIEYRMQELVHHDHAVRVGNPYRRDRNMRRAGEGSQPLFLDRDEDFSGTVWTYWEDIPGRMRPGYTELCVETQRKYVKGMNHITVTPDNAPFFIEDLHPGFFDMKGAANRSDYIRCNILHRYGGIYSDVDIAATSDWEETILRPMEEEGYDTALFHPTGGTFPQLCFMASKPLTDLLIFWKKELGNYLDREGWREPHDYLHVSSEMTAPFFEGNPEYHMKLSSEECMPVAINKLRDLPRMKDMDIEGLKMLVLYNTRMSPGDRLMTAEELLAAGGALPDVFRMLLDRA